MSSTFCSVRTFAAVIVFCISSVGHAVKVHDLRVGSRLTITETTDVMITKCKNLSGLAFARCKSGRAGLLPTVQLQPGDRAVVLKITPLNLPGPVSRWLGYKIILNLEACTGECVRAKYVLQNFSLWQLLHEPWAFDFDFPEASLVTGDR